MSEDLKDANVEESDMKVDEQVEFTTWEEAVLSLKREMRDMTNMTKKIDRGLDALLNTLDTKVESIVASNLSTTVVHKMDEDILPEIQIHGEEKEFKVEPENVKDISFEIEHDIYEEVVFSFEQPTLEDIFEEPNVEKVEVKQLTLYSLFNGMMQTFLGSKDLEACAKDCFAQSCFSISIAVSIFILRFHEFQLGRRIWNPGIIRF